MAKALVASRLYQAMAMEAADDDPDVEIYDELDNYSKIFEDLSLQLLEFCYQSDDDLTQHLLTGNGLFLCEIGSLFCYKDKSSRKFPIKIHFRPYFYKGDAMQTKCIF